MPIGRIKGVATLAEFSCMKNVWPFSPGQKWGPGYEATVRFPVPAKWPLHFHPDFHHGSLSPQAIIQFSF